MVGGALALEEEMITMSREQSDKVELALDVLFGRRINMLDVKSLKPMWDRVVVRLDVPETRTKGGIEIPEESQRDDFLGTVIAIGPGRVTNAGHRNPMELKVGDRIIIGRFMGYKITVGGEKLYMVEEKYVEAVREYEQEDSAHQAA